VNGGNSGNTGVKIIDVCTLNAIISKLFYQNKFDL
jgi:hypothetical protein